MKKVTINLNDTDVQVWFDAVKEDIQSKVSGIKPSNEDVLRRALYLAADTIYETKNSEG